MPNLTNIQETTWTFTILNQRILSSHCLPIPALGLIFVNNQANILVMLRPEWFEHSSELSWAACFTNYAIAFLGFFEIYTIYFSFFLNMILSLFCLFWSYSLVLLFLILINDDEVKKSQNKIIRIRKRRTTRRTTRGTSKKYINKQFSNSNKNDSQLVSFFCDFFLSLIICFCGCGTECQHPQKKKKIINSGTSNSSIFGK